MKDFFIRKVYSRVDLMLFAFGAFLGLWYAMRG